MQKNIEYYTYSTPKISIVLNGKTQPYGLFKSAVEAVNFIRLKLAQTLPDFLAHELSTPDGTIKLTPELFWPVIQ